MINPINPFEDSQGNFLVLVNELGQYSLWPAFKNVPTRWIIVGQQDSRATCLSRIESMWTNMRPNEPI